MSKVTKNFFSNKGLVSEDNLALQSLAAACPSLFAALAGELEDEQGFGVPPARLSFQIKAGKLRGSLIPEKASQGVFFDVSDLQHPFESAEQALNSGAYDVASWAVDKPSSRR